MVASGVLDALIPVLLIALFIAANGLFVAAEFSIILAPYPRIASRVEEGHRQAPYVLEILRSSVRRNDFIATAQIGITVASMGLGMYAEERVAEWLHHFLDDRLPLPPGGIESLALILAVSSLTFLHVVLGEMVPQSMAVQVPETVVLRIAGLMRICEAALKPFARSLNGAGILVMRVVGIPVDTESSRTYSKEEILILIEESVAGGQIDKEDFLYLENIGDFKERTVGQVMTPRTQVHGIAASASREAVWEVIRQTRKSRYPVYGEDLDDVKGILFYKALARATQAASPAFRVADFASPALMVPATLPLVDMLRRFREEKTSIAIVQDEFQSTDGVITMEDLLEEIFGEIQDESDAEAPPFEDLGRGRIRVQGSLLLDELQQHFDLELKADEVDTVGGLVMAHLDRIPEEGDIVACGPVDIRVLAVENRAVRLAELRVKAPPRAP